MGEASPSRRVALSIVSRQRRRNAYARDILRASSDMDALGPHGRALATRLVFGVTSASGELDHIIDRHANHPGSIEPVVRDALRISAFEILYLSTPTAVAVSQGVELVRRTSPKAAGLANAVLRRIAEEDLLEAQTARRQAEAGAATDEDLCVASGLPAWLVCRIVESCGRRAACEVCASQLEPAPVWVAANAALHSPDEARELLEGSMLEPAPMPLPGSFRIGSPADLAPSGLVSSTDMVPADYAAQLVAAISIPENGSSMLEVGQGRGTKTLLMLSIGKQAGIDFSLVATDVSTSKVARAKKRVETSWPNRVIEVPFDGQRLADAELPGALDHEFDGVFVDAPCSGTGTMRRHPETCWSLDESSLHPKAPAGLPTLQLDLLAAASARVAPGGALTYSTCSLLVEEDEDVVRAFLGSEAGKGFEPEPVDAAPALSALPESVRDEVRANMTELGIFRSHPAVGSYDGHFCARLRRKA